MSNLTGVLAIPKLRLKSLKLPSAESQLVVTQSELGEIEAVLARNENELEKYRSTAIDVSIEESLLAKITANFEAEQAQFIAKLVETEEVEVIKRFWTLGVVFRQRFYVLINGG